MKLLAVSWCLPPMVFPRALQVSRLLAALKPLGWDSTVVTVDPASLRSRRPRDAALAAAHAGTYQRVLVPTAEDTLPALALWRAVPWLQWMPDTKRWWSRRAERSALVAARRERPDVLVSFAQPWSDHRVARRVKQRTGLGWVAHFSDPWVDSPYFGGTAWQRRLNARYEAEVVEDADALVFVNDRTADLVLRKYPASAAAKAAVVPHTFEPLAPAPLARPAHASLRLVYTGNLFAGRAAGTLLDALARVRTPLQVALVGQMPADLAHQIRERGLGDVVQILGPRSFTDARAEAARADVLLVIDAPADNSVFLPSKLVDYLAFRRPILALTPNDSVSAALVRRLGGFTAPSDDAVAVAAALDDLGVRWQRGGLDVAPEFDEVAREFAPATVAVQFDQVLRRVVASGRPVMKERIS